MAVAAARSAADAAQRGTSPSDKPATPQNAAPKSPVAVGSANGLRAVARAVERMKSGADPLDAAIEGVNIVEDDPNDMTVGYGGVPNEDGVVQLDACVMHGPTARA
ncbi:MAG TPA: isoaspartyl peptidase/L-asparaginase, partial [Myxococcaceae bacterium]|nr:isoaspartyl peptidase/L-asparaginase [Myxococcaceae bacterium]